MKISLNRARHWFSTIAMVMHLMVAVAVAEERYPLSSPASQKKILSLFPKSDAPASFGTQSETVVRENLQHWARNSKWHPELNEKNVFQARMLHKSIEERNWDIGIGKGGQLYSICSSFGEAISPQTPESPWVDEVFQFVTIYYDRFGRDTGLKKFGTAKLLEANSFVHQSGFYNHGGKIPPFYSPLLAREYNKEDRSYTMLNWSQCPTPSVNRAELLTYVKYRDLGDGVIETTFLVFNYGSSRLTEANPPWGGVRTSVFPEQVLAKPDGSYRYFTPWSYGYRGADSRINIDETGGWAAAVQNAGIPGSYALGLVFGEDTKEANEKGRQGRYDSGNSQHGERDYTVQCWAVFFDDLPGTVNCFRMYYIIGTLDEVAEKAKHYVPYAGYQRIEIKQKDAPRLALYSIRRGNDTVLTANDAAGGEPVAYSYAHPVKGAMPLFVIRDKKTGKSVLTTDPYVMCEREPFENPLKKGEEFFEMYENRSIHHHYRGATEWLEFLGYTIKISDVEADAGSTVSMARVCREEALTFDPGEYSPATDLALPQGGGSP